MEFPHSELWDFTNQVYGRDGVSAACIDLQDRHGLDVNILLMCCWIGASGRGELTPGDIAGADASVNMWQAEVTGALRHIRRRMKSGAGGELVPADLAAALRKRVLDVEIDGEHIAQLALEATIARAVDDTRAAESRATDAAVNLASYLGSNEVAAEAADQDALATILGGTFPDLDPARIRGLVEGSV